MDSKDLTYSGAALVITAAVLYVMSEHWGILDDSVSRLVVFLFGTGMLMLAVRVMIVIDTFRRGL